MVLFVGDKPSRYNTDPDVAFKGAKCEKRLLNWIARMGVEDYILVNRVDSNIDDIISEFIIFNKPIIALGKNASSYLEQFNIEYYALPHPSGLNRLINDKDFINKKIQECGKYILKFYK